MINDINLASFKLFRRVSVDPNLIAVLIGTNGSGKSAILQALLLRFLLEVIHNRMGRSGTVRRDV